jgi:hypothetical protein
MRHLDTVKALIDYTVQGELKVLRYKNSVLDALVKSQLKRYLESDFNCPVLNGNGRCSINVNIIHILKTMQDRVSRAELNVLLDKEVIHLLTECAITCERCVSLCMNEDDPSLMAKCIKLNLDCADMCLHTIKSTTSNFLLVRNSLAAVKELCQKCAQEYRKFKIDYCQACADICERCAAECHDQSLNIIKSHRK